ncbi:MAG TPA: RnfH family protein [Gammaproteobacteria bacterium]|nr:RnfH family protein [Gammaproteobacteria bacterium]HQZ88173.1 RnfH family protein [Gammaproteobacteria bacterium]HRA43162.1 RnfH family protein [Gammaproteobacteria bacterium]
MAPKAISVEVVYAEAEKQVLIRVAVPIGATVLEAITASMVLSQFPYLAESGFLSDRIGIFGKISTLDAVLKAGDRVEIYRDLTIDPKEARRLKAEISRRQKAQAFDEKKRKQKVARKEKILLYKKEKKP